MQPLYFVETKSAKVGRWFIECDRDSNSRQHVLELIRTREVDPIKVLEVTEPNEYFPEGRVRDVTFDDDFAEAIVHARGHEIASKLFSQLAALDHSRDLRKHEAVS